MLQRFLSSDRIPRTAHRSHVHVLTFQEVRVPVRPPLAHAAPPLPGKPISHNELMRRAKAQRRKPLPPQAIAVNANRLHNFFESRRPRVS